MKNPMLYSGKFLTPFLLSALVHPWTFSLVVLVTPLNVEQMGFLLLTLITFFIFGVVHSVDIEQWSLIKWVLCFCSLCSSCYTPEL